MEGKGITTFKKRLLFISLFIVPFLAGMALIFVGKGIGSLPTLHKTNMVEVDGKLVQQFYQVPDFSANTFEGGEYEFSRNDSSLFVLCLFEEERSEVWEKHLSYMSMILARYENVKLVSVFENDPKLFSWGEDPVPFFNRHERWEAVWLGHSDFKALTSSLKLYRDTTTNCFPYVILDKEKHIRTYCPINDLKKARDVPKLLKILNNQYVAKKVELTAKPE